MTPVTFGPNHYVPILKVKRAEKAALRQLQPVLRSRITPLLEIVEWNEKKEKTLEEHLDTAFRHLAESVKGYPRCCLDVKEIDPAGAQAAAAVFNRAAAAGITFTPVTGVSRTVDVNAALGHQDRGLAIRLERHEFETGDLAIKIESFLETHQVAANNIDLIVDLGAVENMIPQGVETLTDAFLDEEPDHASWRTFTVSACAFPRSMGCVERHSHELVERVDWMAWKNNLHGRRAHLARLPSFGDCAIGPQEFNQRAGIPLRVFSCGANFSEVQLLVPGMSMHQAPPRRDKAGSDLQEPISYYQSRPVQDLPVHIDLLAEAAQTVSIRLDFVAVQQTVHHGDVEPHAAATQP